MGSRFCGVIISGIESWDILNGNCYDDSFREFDFYGKMHRFGRERGGVKHSSRRFGELLDVIDQFVYLADLRSALKCL